MTSRLSLIAAALALTTGAALAQQQGVTKDEIMEVFLQVAIYCGVPTGVEVCPSMVHGGPYPASTDARFTAVGTASIRRWARPACWQDWPDAALPPELRDGNPRGIRRVADAAMD